MLSGSELEFWWVLFCYNRIVRRVLSFLFSVGKIGYIVEEGWKFCYILGGVCFHLVRRLGIHQELVKEVQVLVRSCYILVEDQLISWRLKQLEVGSFGWEFRYSLLRKFG